METQYFDVNAQDWLIGAATVDHCAAPLIARRKPVIQTAPDGTVTRYVSLTEAATMSGFNETLIRDMIFRARPNKTGYEWQYEKIEETTQKHP
jgi:hypothetical protein